MNIKEREDILKQEKEVLAEIDNTPNIRDRFMLHRKYSLVFKLANKAREENAIDIIRKEYETTGKCNHYFKSIEDSYRSNRQDSRCIICGEINSYMGND